ncbi:frataxin homolog, mitochondrial [Episyrphus balteatus]|uniref:frataxin homolog, mitochondrial n=1 Tax=Episyrphus balteatus TaxID=286459 RepID=UPI002486C38C|nr:frataxin homolog, mitochondrial [Episyrphus balteatus]
MAFTIRLFGNICKNTLLTTTCRQRIINPSCLAKFSSANKEADFPLLDAASYDKVCTETLDSLCYYFEEITEGANNLGSTDVTYGDGVLTVKLGEEHGTYVINRQSPNKQIWLSSPTSGPKRYDFVGPHKDEGKWIYKHTGESLHELLQNEIKKIIKEEDIDFFTLPYSK